MTALDLFQVRPLRLQQYDLGQQAYHKHQSIDSHGLIAGDPGVIDFRAGYLQAEASDQAVAYWAQVNEDAVARARGI